MRYLWILVTAAILILSGVVWYAGVFGNAYLKLSGESIYQLTEDGNVAAALQKLRIAEILRADTAPYDRDGRNWYAAIGAYFLGNARYTDAVSTLQPRRALLASGDLFVLALAYLEQAQSDNAVVVLNYGIRKYPDAVPLYLLKISAFVNAGRNAEARAALAEAIAKFPSNTAFPNLRNTLYAQ